ETAGMATEDAGITARVEPLDVEDAPLFKIRCRQADVVPQGVVDAFHHRLGTEPEPFQGITAHKHLPCGGTDDEIALLQSLQKPDITHFIGKPMRSGLRQPRAPADLSRTEPGMVNIKSLQDTHRPLEDGFT